MKKILFLLLCTVSIYGQTYPTNPTAFGKISINTNVEDNTAAKISVQSADNRINWLQPVNIPIPTTPTNYVPTAPTLGGHLSGIDAKLGTFSATTAGISTRVWFTADVSVVSATNYYATNATSKGTAASAIQNVVNNDNEKKYFAQDLIGNPFATATTFPPGVYAGNLSASTSPNSAQQKWTVELYKCNNAGVPINSGVTGAPIGSLGVQVITILDSGLLTLADGSVTNVSVSGNLIGTGFSIAVGERIRYHVSAEKVGTAGANITQSVYYGTSYNSFIDVPVTFSLQSVYNTSPTPQIVTNSTQGALTIKRGSAADTDNILVGQNGAGVNTTTITGAGVFTGSVLNSNGSIFSSSGIARGNYFTNTLNAVANNDLLIGLDVAPIFNKGAFTGVTTTAFRLNDLILLTGPATTQNTFYGNDRIDVFGSTNFAIRTNGSSSVMLHALGTGDILFASGVTFKAKMFNSTGNWVFQSTGVLTDNGTDKLQVAGTVLSTGFKVSGTPGYLKSDGTVDTNIDVVHKSGTETITGFKTFSGSLNNILLLTKSSLVPDSGVTMEQGVGFAQIDVGGVVGNAGYAVTAYNVTQNSSFGIVSQVAQSADIGNIPLNTIQGNRLTDAGFVASTVLTRPILAVNNFNNRLFTIQANGTVNINNLTGSTTRQVVVDASGNLLATDVKITITTSTSITTATTDTNGVGQNGKHVVIDNGSSNINLTCNGGVTTSYGKVGSGIITFVQGSGRTLVLLSGTAVFNGIAGSTATLWSNGTTDYLTINNY
jgi:hypothetical protein